MLPEIKCVINDKYKLLESVSQVSDFSNLLESLDKFEMKLNAAISKLIKDAGDLGEECSVDEDEEEQEEDQMSPKKKKKS